MARVKHYHDNVKSLLEAFMSSACGRHPPTGHTRERRLFFEGDRLFSYGYHYELCRRVNGVYVVNSEKSTNTTNRQRWSLICRLRYFERKSVFGDPSAFVSPPIAGANPKGIRVFPTMTNTSAIASREKLIGMGHNVKRELPTDRNVLEYVPRTNDYCTWAGEIQAAVNRRISQRLNRSIGTYLKRSDKAIEKQKSTT